MPADLPRLTTERLLLRPFIEHGGPAVERLAGDRAVAETTLALPIRIPPAVAARGSQRTPPRGKAKDTALYAILESEWRA